MVVGFGFGQSFTVKQKKVSHQNRYSLLLKSFRHPLVGATLLSNKMMSDLNEIIIDDNKEELKNVQNIVRLREILFYYSSNILRFNHKVDKFESNGQKMMGRNK